MTALRHAWNYLWGLGVPGNVVATPVIAALAVIGDRLFLRKARKLRERHIAEIHRLLHHAHSDTAKQLGQTPHGGWAE